MHLPNEHFYFSKFIRACRLIVSILFYRYRIQLGSKITMPTFPITETHMKYCDEESLSSKLLNIETQAISSDGSKIHQEFYSHSELKWMLHSNNFKLYQTFEDFRKTIHSKLKQLELITKSFSENRKRKHLQKVIPILKKKYHFKFD